MRFSIVTPTSNSERYLTETIQSVISQKGDFEIDYFIVDNCSGDGSLDIAQRYQWMLDTGQLRPNCRKLGLKIISKPDKGMYDAISRGFAGTQGEVMAWINSDDIYLPGAFNAVYRVFTELPKVAWLKGITSYMNEHSEIVQGGECYLYDQRWIEMGYCGLLFPFVQQDSVFWRRALWDKVGGCDTDAKLVGDYLLWRSFARHEPLYSFYRYVSCFRRSPNQLSAQIAAYWHEARSKEAFPDATQQGHLTRCLNTPWLPRWLRIWERRRVFGFERFHALCEDAGRWMLATGTSGAHPRQVDDRVNAAVLA